MDSKYIQRCASFRTRPLFLARRIIDASSEYIASDAVAAPLCHWVRLDLPDPPADRCDLRDGVYHWTFRSVCLFLLKFVASC